MSLVVGSLEREGVRVMWGCEPQQVRKAGRRGGGEEGPLNVGWLDKDTGDVHQVWSTFWTSGLFYPSACCVCNNLCADRENGTLCSLLQVKCI